MFSTPSLVSILTKSFANNINTLNEHSSISICAVDINAHAYLLFNGGVWSQLKDDAGWQIRKMGYYTLGLTSTVPENVKVNLFCLYYDKDRKQVYKRALGTLENGTSEKIFSFAAMGNSHFFNLALYLPIQKQKRHMLIENINLSFENYL